MHRGPPSGLRVLFADNVGGSITVAAGGAATFVLTVGDNKGNGTISQPMAGGTVVSITTSNGSVVGSNSFAMPCANGNGPVNFTFTVEGDNTSDSGVINVEVASPSGIITTYSIVFND